MTAPNKMVIVIEMPQDLGTIADLLARLGRAWPNVPLSAPDFDTLRIEPTDSVIMIPGKP